MDIKYSEYLLHPKKRANRHTQLDPKKGVFLKGTLNGRSCYADYFPHASLGDRSVEEFLLAFKHQTQEYDQKVFHLLKKDIDYQKTPATPFRNHQLWSGIENLKSPVVKYKLLDLKDDFFLTLLEKGTRIRFDGNAMHTRESLQEFIDSIPRALHSLIDYMEDPIPDTDWSNLNIKSARDFIDGSPYAYYIYKPNVEFFPTSSVPVIFSAYMGSDLGTWHAYSELVESGALKLTHGLVTEEFYEEQQPLFTGSYFDHFTPDLEVVHKIYRDLADRDWKDLCSI